MEGENRSGVGSQTHRVMRKQFSKREGIKQQLLESRKMQRGRHMLQKLKTTRKWKKKMQQSPYTINLVAEKERIEEETGSRLREERRKQAMFERRREKVKSEIILRALSEAQHLEQLREEKRLIAQEEKRLKALLDIERAKQKRKADLMLAKRAEHERVTAALKHKRRERLHAVKQMKAQEVALLKEKLEISSAPTYGIRIGAGVTGELGGSMGV